jgi:adenylate cyclase
MEYALQIAEACGDDNVLCSVKYLLGTALVFRGNQTDRQRRLGLLAQVRDQCSEERFPQSELPLIDVYRAFESARDGDYDGALPQMRTSVEELSTRRQFVYVVGAAALLVETLIGRFKESDLSEAEGVVERLAAIPGDEWVARDIMLLRLRTMLARAHGNEAGYLDLRDRYRALTTSLGFEGTHAVGRGDAVTGLGLSRIPSCRSAAAR